MVEIPSAVTACPHDLDVGSERGDRKGRGQILKTRRAELLKVVAQVRILSPPCGASVHADDDVTQFTGRE